MTGLATLAWFAGHEARLGLRDVSSMLRAGRKARLAPAIVLVTALALLHLVAWATVGTAAAEGRALDVRMLVLVTTGLALTLLLLLSQGIESVTRVLYGRGDLELILSSPVPARLVLATRIAIVGLSTGATALLVAGPFANVMAALGGARWLFVYPTVVALGFAATALALLITLGLVRWLGPSRTRLAAQIAAAVIGAGFAIGLQVAAIVETGEISRYAVLASDAVLALAPGPDSPVWLPARAATGQPSAALIVVAGCLALFGATLAACLAPFERGVHAMAGFAEPASRSRPGRPFASQAPGPTLRRKEWRLLARDPWLVSQTLMQVLYLVPPALLLWRSYGEGEGRLLVLAPVLVMAAGQLAGGLAWLAISGEDAPDLVATAPVRPAEIVRAKLAAILTVLAAMFGPFALALGFVSIGIGIWVGLGVTAAGLSAFAIQFWFRQPGRRSQFRRRQTASRLATITEAFSSILWAGTAALACAGTLLAIAVAALALLNLLVARLLSPR